MARLRPFFALRPVPEKASQVASVPYDVISTAEARELAKGNPLSFLHASRAEIDLPLHTNPYSDEVYAKALENFKRLEREVPLITEETRSLYIYRQKMGEHVQTGVVGCVAVDDYDEDLIKKHEKTRKDKEDDRTRHIVTTSAHSGPVFLTYRGNAAINGLVDRVVLNPSLYDIVAPDGVVHTVWRIVDTADFVDAFSRVPITYVADGHHRAKSASRTREAKRAANPGHTGQEEYNFFLAVIFPGDQLQILPYNRVVKDLAGRSPHDFLTTLQDRFDVSKNSPPSPKETGQVSVYLDTKWYGLTLKAGRENLSRTDRLDVSLLQDQVLSPLLKIEDVRTDKRIDFVGGIRGTKELEKLVDSGKFAVAFSMYPVTVEDLMAVADAGEIMPPKSTWFEPKLRDAFLIHRF